MSLKSFAALSLLLMSAGTLVSRAESSERRTVMFRPAISTSAPMAFIMRSVWSRDRPGCRTVVSPSAWIPAISMQDFS